MNTTRLVTLVAATIITAAESLLFLWVLAPARVEATPVVGTEAIPVIVVTAHRDQDARSTVLAAGSASAGNHVHH
jgi:hypothetical protein